MKIYELNYLISPEVSQEDHKNLSDKMKEFIQENGGILKDSKVMPKQSLVSLVFHFDPGKIGEIEKKIKLESQVIRHMILVKKIRKIKPGPPPRPSTQPASGPKLPTIHTQKKPKEKVELKDIEKKLEEILKE